MFNTLPSLTLIKALTAGKGCAALLATLAKSALLAVLDGGAALVDLKVWVARIAQSFIAVGAVPILVDLLVALFANIVRVRDVFVAVLALRARNGSLGASDKDVVRRLALGEALLEATLDTAIKDPVEEAGGDRALVVVIVDVRDFFGRIASPT